MITPFLDSLYQKEKVMMLRLQHICLFIRLITVGIIVTSLLQGTLLCDTCVAEEAIQILKEEKTIVLTGEISKSLGAYEQHLRGAVEYLVCGRGGKEYESIIIVESSARDIHEAMLKLGVKKGTPPSYNEEQDKMISPKGTTVLLFVEWRANGETKRVRGEDLLYNVHTQKPMKHVAWIFSGSRMVPDLESEDEAATIPQAFMGNDIVALNHLDGSTLFQNPLPEAAEENTYKKNEKLLPPLGTPVKLTIQVNRKMQHYILISGRVQGVNFRYFTKQNATRLGIRGYVRNLPNGKVEVVAEGDKVTLDQFVTILWKGPPVARVEDVKVEQRPFGRKHTSFEVKY